MNTIHRFVIGCAIAGLMPAALLSQDEALDQIAANQNRVAAGKIENGRINVQLELRNGIWHPESEDGPQLYVQAIAEAGHASQIPGPMLRMHEGDVVHATVANKLGMKATIYGLCTRPCDAKSGTEIPENESREFNFTAGAAGTYYYWARTTEPLKTPKQILVEPLRNDAQMNGAFIVDPAGSVAADRVFVINAMFLDSDPVHQDLEVLSINGKSYPYTEPLAYTAGETIRWRVLNPGVSEHPMHLHGSFFKIASIGSFATDTAYTPEQRQSVVTQDLTRGQTMMMEWTPEHAGRWLFHCHFAAHMSTDARLPMLVSADVKPPALSREATDANAYKKSMYGMPDMAGLVLTINVKASSAAAAPLSTIAPRKIDLVIEPTTAAGKLPTFSCSVREGKKMVASGDTSVGPPIILTRGEPAEITVINHLAEPTTIHWHGLELESYYDGVMGGGMGDQVTPAIQPGASFVARFTPEHAGTFIYHTHAAGPNQLPGGIYGGIIVLEKGAAFDPEHDRLLVIGTREAEFFSSRLTLNGSEKPGSFKLDHGTTYRFRVINMGANLVAAVSLGNPDKPVMWRPMAKDGAPVPLRLAAATPASLHITSGETYDFEFRPETAGEIPFQIGNAFSKGKLVSTFVVQ